MFKKLVSRLNSDVSSVISPDHPNLLSAPDCLIANNGQMNAYYTIKWNEKKRIKNLLSRLLLSRMALPAHTKHILVISKNDYHSGLFILPRYFDETINEIELESTILLLKEESKKSSIEKAMQGRKDHYIKYSVLYNQSLQQTKADIENERTITINQDDFDDVFYSDWSYPYHYDRPRFKSEYFHRKDRLVFSIPKFKESKNKFDLLKKLCLSALQVDSEFHDGIFNSKDIYGKLIISDNMPHYRHDLFKTIRSAAFAGLSLSRAKNVESIENYFNFLEHKVEESIYEYNKKQNKYSKRSYKR